MSFHPYEAENSNFVSANPYQTPLEASFTSIPTSADDVELAGRLNRLGAVILDGIIMMVVTLPTMWFTGYLQRVATNDVTLGEQVLQMVPFANFLGLVDALFIFRQDRRCVHDLLAGTKVINI